jgi:two-component system sensor histidine kinase KdpD
MLEEGRRLAATGTDVVVGYLEEHPDEDATTIAEGLPVVPPKQVAYRGTTFRELDFDAILARCPRVVLVDELAHSNVPGQRHAKRWQDVEDLLDAGFDVISNVNAQHLDSLHDAVERLTNVPQRETVPDDVVATADRVDLVDLDPEELRERVRQRATPAANGTSAALERWFTAENIGALSGLASGWLAQHAPDEEPQRVEPDPDATVLVSLDAGYRGDRIVRRAADIARRANARLIGVHVSVPTGLVTSESGLEHRRRLLAELDGSYAEVGAIDRGDAFMKFARAQGTTEVVVGAPPRSRWHRLLHGAEIDRLVEQASGAIDLHVIPIDDVSPARPPDADRSRRERIAPRRRVLAWSLAVLGPPVVAISLSPWHASLGLAGALLALLLVTTVTAAIGGLVPALVATALALALGDFLFTVPYHSFRVDRLVDVVGLIVFAGVAGLVSVLVDRVARASLLAVQVRAEAEGLTRLGAALLPDAVVRSDALLDEIRTVFGLDSVALMTRGQTGWEVVRAAGSPVPARPDDGAAVLDLSADSVLVLTGGGLPEAGSPLLRELVAEMDRSAARAQLGRLPR